jgi:hypothetical protein
MLGMEFLPPDMQAAMKRYMGGGQGDSSGAENTSSDESDGESSTVSRVDKILLSRNKVRFLQPLQQQCLDYVIKNHETLAKTQRKQFAKIGAYF